MLLSPVPSQWRVAARLRAACTIADVVIELSTPRVDELDDAVRALRDWQDDLAPMQLHPGDLGWFWQFGTEAMAAALRIWRRDEQVLAVGFLDGPDVLRLTVAPEVRNDEVLAGQLVEDLADPGRGVLPAGKVAVETPSGTLVQQQLTDSGWDLGESWTPLRRDLTEPVEQPALRIEVVGPEQASAFVAVHCSAWDSPRFTVELWHTMTTGPTYADARCLLGYDDQGIAVAGVTAWSVGPGKPGLLEPLGVHADHRGHGHARAMCIAAAAALQELGSSSVQVCTESARVAAVATYKSAGFEPLPPRLDRSRDA